MSQTLNFIRKDRLYILLLIFVILLNVLMMVGHDMKSGAHLKKGGPEVRKVGEGLMLQREEVEKIFARKKYLPLLMSMMTLLTLSVIMLGIVVDVILLSLLFAKKKMNIATQALKKAVGWNLWDVAKVVILFLFFGYMVIMIESALARIFPVLKHDNFRMIINSSLMDVLVIVFILYFTVEQYREKLAALGITLKNFFKNVFYGVTGYIATVPILVAALIIVMVVTKLVHYVPVRQPIVDVFLKEKDASFLMYTSFFAALVGPVIEELFFRGFMYSALKKYARPFLSAFITAAIFAVLHTNIVGFLPIMVLGLLLAFLYEKTGTLVAPITVHIMHNLTMVSYVFLIKQLQA